MIKDNVVQLGPYWEDCPMWWRNYVIDTRNKVDTKEYIYSRLKEEYDAHSYNIDADNRKIVFNSNDDLLVFILTWS